MFKPSLSRFSRFIPLLCALSILIPSSAEAAFNLSVAPLRGGNDIRFDSVHIGREVRNEEVRVSVTSTEGARYRISQILQFPFTNEAGQTLDADAVSVFSPSSVRGYLDARLPDPLRMGHRNIYTSNEAGESDEFMLVFAANPPGGTPSGTYQSEISFVLEPTAGGLASQVVTLNIFMHVISDSTVTVRGSRGESTLDLGHIDNRKTSGEGELIIEVQTNFGTAYRVYQSLAQPLTNAEGVFLPDESLVVTGGEASTGPVRAVGNRVDTSRQLVYESDERGSASTIQLKYQTQGLESAVKGEYLSSLTIEVESSTGSFQPKHFQLPVRLSIDAVFLLDVKFESGSGLNFGQIKPLDDVTVRKVTLQVRSNLGTAYQVGQVVSKPMMNEEGRRLPADRFVVSAATPSTGRVPIGQGEPVREGETVVFVSDIKGSPETLYLEYRLSPPSDARGGQYQSDITYSLSSL